MQQSIKPEALALGLLMQNNGLIPRVIEKMGLNLQYIISELEKEMNNYPKVEVKISNENLSLDQKTNSILNRAEKIMNEMGDSFLSVEHIFKAMIEEMPIFKRLGINLEKYMEVLMNIRGNRKVDNQNQDGAGPGKSGHDQSQRSSDGKNGRQADRTASQKHHEGHPKISPVTDA